MGRKNNSNKNPKKSFVREQNLKPSSNPRNYLSRFLGMNLLFTGVPDSISQPKIYFNRRNPINFPHTILIKDVYCEKYKIWIDHVWVPFSEEFEAAKFEFNTRISFRAEVVEYWKNSIAYTLGNIQNIQQIRKTQPNILF